MRKGLLSQPALLNRREQPDGTGGRDRRGDGSRRRMRLSDVSSGRPLKGAPFSSAASIPVVKQ